MSPADTVPAVTGTPALTGGGAGASAAGAGLRTRYKPAPAAATARAAVAAIAAFLMPRPLRGRRGIVSNVYYRQGIRLASPLIEHSIFRANCPTLSREAAQGGALAIGVPSSPVPRHDWERRRFRQRAPFRGRSRSWLLTTPCAPFCRSPAGRPRKLRRPPPRRGSPRG